MKLKMMVVMMMAMLLAVASSVSFAEVVTGEVAPDFTLTDTNHKTHSLSDFKGKFVVLEWVNYECPFVVKHYESENMQNLQKTYADKGVVWLSINSSASGKQGFYAYNEINQIMENSGASPAAYLVDESGDVGRLYGAQTTPHMFVIDPEGVIIYQGAIDSNPSFDVKDIPDAENYVVAALEAAMAGEEVEVGSTKSYGCSVKY